MIYDGPGESFFPAPIAEQGAEPSVNGAIRSLLVLALLVAGLCLGLPAMAQTTSAALRVSAS